MEEVERDFNHPSIVCWVPHNETWDKNGARQYNETLGLVYDITKKLDASRPVIDTSGNYHVRTDIFDVHYYEQNIEEFSHLMEDFDKGIVKDQIYGMDKTRQSYNGEPVFISEYVKNNYVIDEEVLYVHGKRRGVPRKRCELYLF